MGFCGIGGDVGVAVSIVSLVVWVVWVMSCGWLVLFVMLWCCCGGVDRGDGVSVAVHRCW